MPAVPWDYDSHVLVPACWPERCGSAVRLLEGRETRPTARPAWPRPGAPGKVGTVVTNAYAIVTSRVDGRGRLGGQAGRRGGRATPTESGVTHQDGRDGHGELAGPHLPGDVGALAGQVGSRGARLRQPGLVAELAAFANSTGSTTSTSTWPAWTGTITDRRHTTVSLAGTTGYATYGSCLRWIRCPARVRRVDARSDVDGPYRRDTADPSIVCACAT